MIKPTHIKSKNNGFMHKIDDCNETHLKVLGDWYKWNAPIICGFHNVVCPNKPECIKQAKWPDSQGNKIHEGDKITYRSNSMRHEIYFEDGEFFATGGAANSTPIKVTEYLASKSKVRSSKVKYTDAQRAAGMHLFKEDVKPFKHRTQRGG